MFVEADVELKHQIKNDYFRIFSLFYLSVCLSDETEATKFLDSLGQNVHIHPPLDFQLNTTLTMKKQ